MTNTVLLLVFKLTKQMLDYMFLFLHFGKQSQNCNGSVYFEQQNKQNYSHHSKVLDLFGKKEIHVTSPPALGFKSPQSTSTSIALIPGILVICVFEEFVAVKVTGKLEASFN